MLYNVYMCMFAASVSICYEYFEPENAQRCTQQEIACELHSNWILNFDHIQLVIMFLDFFSFAIINSETLCSK